MIKKNQIKINYYKYITIILLAIIITSTIIFFYQKNIDTSYSKGYKQGQIDIIYYISNKILTDNNIIITLENNKSIQLVPSTFVQQAQENIIKEIISQINENGIISLYNENETITLIKYQQ